VSPSFSSPGPDASTTNELPSGRPPAAQARARDYARTGGASNAWAEAVNHLIKNQKRQAHGYRTWEGFRSQIIWCFGEVVDPETGEILPLRSLPRGTGATWLQPQFA
jgi:hypothetical protein